MISAVSTGTSTREQEHAALTELAGQFSTYYGYLSAVIDGYTDLTGRNWRVFSMGTRTAAYMIQHAMITGHGPAVLSIYSLTSRALADLIDEVAALPAGTNIEHYLMHEHAYPADPACYVSR